MQIFLPTGFNLSFAGGKAGLFGLGLTRVFSSFCVRRVCLNAGQPVEESGHNLNETRLFKGFFRLAPLLLKSFCNFGTRKI
jgi:hypothetical protein